MKKKLMITLMVALLICGTVTVSALDPPEDVIELTPDTNGECTLDLQICLVGDANGNGSVNLADYMAVVKHVKKSEIITDEYLLQCADANQNGSVNLADYMAIVKHVKKTQLLW